MRARSSTPKPPPNGSLSTPPLSLLVLVGDKGPTVLLGEECREAAGAAQPPSAAALEVLRASRGVHRAEMALRAAAGEEDLRSLRSALHRAEETLRAAIENLDTANDGIS